jgi:4-hydroxybenzoate polyprenyltransferase/phosphoserine phosphatase
VEQVLTRRLRFRIDYPAEQGTNSASVAALRSRHPSSFRSNLISFGASQWYSFGLIDSVARGPPDQSRGVPMLDLKQSTESDSQLVPLVVDLDGTLIRSDLLIETLFAELGQRPAAMFDLLPNILAGKAAFKHRLAETAPLDVTSLPYDDMVLTLIRRARADGRLVYLASASNEKLVADVARHLDLFDGWFGSSETLNLKGAAKADLLVKTFGARQFDYVGDDTADLAVWEQARKSITIRAPAAVKRNLPAFSDHVEHLDAPQATPAEWMKLLRVHQWVKNALVFIPLLMAHQFNGVALMHALLAFIAFSLCASSVYILNDLVDVQADRAHPTKRTRAFASGTVPITAGLLAVPGLWLASFAVASLTSLTFVLVLLTYFALTTAYSFVLKRKMLVDAFTLASLYTIRVIGGAAAVSVVLSHWLLAFSMFMFIALALIKRYVELAMLADRNLPNPANRNYQVNDLDIIAALAAASGYNAVVVLALYINSDAVVPLYRHSDLLWFICPLVLYWFSRVLLLAHRRLMHDDPIVFALKDRISLLTAGFVAVLVLAAI